MGRGWQQASFEDMTLWDYFDIGSAQEVKKLMPLPASTVVRHGRQLLDSCSRYMPDAQGKIYNYVPDLDAAVLSENCRAVSVTGQSLKFKAREAQSFRLSASA